ncbi:MAG: (Fe-S)-binding protein, partial [Thermoproteota archaeon]
MPGKWDWLKDELRASGMARATPLVLRFIGGRLRGPDDLVKCALCPNMCRHACPVGIVDGRET